MHIELEASVPVYMPQRRSLVIPLNESILRMLEVFDFGYVQRKLAELVNSSRYQESVSLWTRNRIAAGAIGEVGIRQSTVLDRSAEVKARFSGRQGPDPTLKSLEFYKFLRSRVVSPELAMCYLVMEKMEREESQQNRGQKHWSSIAT